MESMSMVEGEVLFPRRTEFVDLFGERQAMPDIFLYERWDLPCVCI